MSFNKIRLLSRLRFPQHSKSLGKAVFVSWVGLLCLQQLRVYLFNENQYKLIQRVEKEEQAPVNNILEYDFRKRDQWEGTTLEVAGTIGKERMFVRRKEGDREGYLMFARMVMAKNTNDGQYQNKREDEIQRQVQKAIAYTVNLGWVPAEYKSQLKDTLEPEHFLEKEVNERGISEMVLKERLDGLQRAPRENAEDKEDIYQMKVVVRRGEEEDILNGRVNDLEKVYFRHIDLSLARRLFRITNEANAESIYLQRVIDDEEYNKLAAAEESEESEESKVNIVEAGCKNTVIRSLIDESVCFRKSVLFQNVVTFVGAFVASMLL